MMALVLLEFLLGMGLNLFTILPMGTPAEVLGASPLLIVHLVVGVLVVGISVRATFLASQSRFPRLLAVTAFGLASALGSFLAGLSFAFGGQSAVSSYVMATGAVGVLIVAAVLLWFQGTVSAAARTVPPIRSGG